MVKHAVCADWTSCLDELLTGRCNASPVMHYRPAENRMKGVGRLNAFLARARAGPFEHAVLGNEAADMDSVVCSVVYAWLLSERTGQLHAPVLNVAPADLALRTDVTALLSLARVDSGALLFAPQVALEEQWLHLVDHNRLAAAQERLEGRVVEVLDHHRDDGRCAGASTRHVVFPLGSCSSLVAQAVLTHARSVLAEDASMATLLLAPILIDTGNLDPKLGKTEPLDAEMAAAMARWAGLEDAVARKQFFSTLHDAKFDVSGLTVAELLRRDYKEFVAGGRRLGMSAVLRDLRAMEAKELQASAEQWMATQRLDVLVVMTAFYEGPERIFSRQNWVLAREESVADAIGSHLASDVSLQLTPLPLGDGVRGRAYSQGDVRPSRKQLAPLVIDFIEKSKL